MYKIGELYTHIDKNYNFHQYYDYNTDEWLWFHFNNNVKKTDKLLLYLGPITNTNTKGMGVFLFKGKKIAVRMVELYMIELSNIGKE